MQKGLIRFKRVNFSPDGKMLASASGSNVRLWNVETGKEKCLLKGHRAEIYGLSFSPNGKILASGSYDNIVYLWDVQTGKQKSVLTETDPVMNISFSPGGKTLAMGLAPNTIHLRDLSFFYEIRNSRLTEEKVREAEETYKLKLVNLELQPIKSERNLYGVKPEPPKWPKTHPFHWLSKAKSGDTEAMIQLGIIYDRDNELEKAYFWYTKAVEAGSEWGKERIRIFRQWLTLHKDNYPEAYQKYCLKPDSDD